MSNEAFLALPALMFACALALFLLALTGRGLTPGAAVNAIGGLTVAILMAKTLREGDDDLWPAASAVLAAELVIALTSLLFFSRRTRPLTIAVKTGLAIQSALAAALLAFAILFSNASFAWH